MRAIHVLVVVLCCWPSVTWAQTLSDDVESLMSAWERDGAKIQRLDPIFLQRGQSQTVKVSGDNNLQGSCTTVLFVSERAVRFSVRQAAPKSAARAPKVKARAEKSRGGMVRIESCTAVVEHERPFTLTMISPAGAVEVVLANSASRVGTVDEALPRRARGLTAAETFLGPALRPAPYGQRLSLAKQGARLDGARTTSEIRVPAGQQGRGRVRLNLREGCHRVTVIAPASPQGRGLDVDAELRQPGRSDPIKWDRGDAPDARLDFCLGENGPVELSFGGAAARTSVSVLDAYWPPLPGLVRTWGAQARAALGWALHRRASPRVLDAPARQFVGASGLTELTVPVEPQACYLVAMGLTRGKAEAARLSVRVGGRSLYDDASDYPHGAAVSFCARGARQARLQMAVRGRVAWWTAALWPLGGEE